MEFGTIIVATEPGTEIGIKVGITNEVDLRYSIVTNYCTISMLDVEIRSDYQMIQRPGGFEMTVE